jgi:hypothetical protein
MADWYYQLKGEVVGPVTPEELEEKTDQGEIEEQTLVREGVEGRWIRAAEVEGLFVVPTGGGLVSSEQTSEALAAAAAQIPPVSEPVSEPAHEVPRSPLTLRPCSDCGTMVSQKAAACPNCGRSFHEPSVTIPYLGEHPIPVWAFFIVLAVLFVLASPVVVHRAALRLASSTIEDAAEANGVALMAAAFYVVSMVSCAVLGGAVGAPRMAYYTGLLLGLFFGPLGVFAAFAIDKRPQCPNCYSRLDGLARECPACHAELTWAMQMRWY